jgi:pimeloyl-ACP methyl ester carboxylesterase
MRSVLAVAAMALAASGFGQTSQPYTDVPYVATPQNVVDAMLDLAGIKANDVVVDLGSGDGRIPIAAAKRFDAHAIGIEIDPDLVRQSQALAHQEGVADKVRFIQADLFEYDLREATVVTMFLTPGVNLRLRPKLLKELKPGSRIVCHRFDMGAWVPTKTLSIDNDHLYLWIVPSCLAACGKFAPPAATPPQIQLSKDKLEAMFAYDDAAPLDFHSEDSETTSAPHVTRVSYSGARGPVSATLVTPRGTPGRTAKYPAIIFAHDYGKKDEFLSEAMLLAQATPQALSLLVDAPAERPVGWRRNFNSLMENDNDRDIHIQAVIDIRRGLDLLAARADVDPARIAYVGHGYGANWGAILGSIEPRFRAFVLIAGFPSFGELVGSDDPDWANMRYALGSDRVARYQSSISAVDPILFTRYWKQTPVLLQFGRFDEFVSRESAERLANSIPGRPTALFYDAGHSVNAPGAMIDRDAFLARYFRSPQ